MLSGRARRVVRQGWPAERALREAERQFDAGRPGAAVRLLAATVLSGRDPDTAPPDEDLVRAAVLLVRAVEAVPEGERDTAGQVSLAWAGYAHRAAHALHSASPSLHLVQIAAGALALALQGVGRWEDAIAARRESAEAAAELGDVHAAVLGWLGLAFTLHTAGRCHDARTAAAAHARAHHDGAVCADRCWSRVLAAAADRVHQEVLGTLLPLHEQDRSSEVLPVLAAYLAGLDPAGSPPGVGPAGLAVMYALHAVTHPVSHPAETVLGWASHACRAAETLAEEAAFWALAQTALQQAAGVYQARDLAVDTARTLLAYHTRRGAGDAAAAVNARLVLGEALHTAGYCTDAAEQALAGWTQAMRQLNPDDPAQRQAGLDAGTATATLLSDCHRHSDAVTVLADTVRRFHTPAGDADDSDGACRDAAAGVRGRSGRHSAEFHPDDPCSGDEHAGQLTAATAVLNPATAGPCSGVAR
ncbi:hypothetical protein [Dactylosporangium salmoneum]|uniref:hypothetical protein n=1 Tax=Dactylosporangium salmoneum TaxID=53361 RepID=UPI0031CDB0F0